MEYLSARVCMEVNSTSLTTNTQQTQLNEYKYTHTAELEEGLTASILASWRSGHSADHHTASSLTLPKTLSQHRHHRLS